MTISLRLTVEEAIAGMESDVNQMNAVTAEANMHPAQINSSPFSYQSKHPALLAKPFACQICGKTFMQELGLSYHANDIEILTSSISKMPPS